MKYLFMILMTCLMMIGCANKTDSNPEQLNEHWYGVYQEATNNKRIIITEGYFRIDHWINGFWTRVDEGYTMDDLESKYYQIKMVNRNIEVVEEINGVYVGTTYYWISN